jgi:hypothetical protein
MAYAIEAYEATGAIALAQIYSISDLQLLIGQTAKLRRDPAEYKKEVDRADTARFLEEEVDTVFTSEDGDTFSLSQFF